LNEPYILAEEATEFFPFTEYDRRCTASALNSFTRFGIYLGVVLALVRLEPAWLLVGVTFAAFAVGAWLYMESQGNTRIEGFTNTTSPIVEPREVINQYVPDVIGVSGRTLPSAANPFMNVLLTEIGDNPYRSPAASVLSENVKNELDGYFDTMFARDPGDVFQHTQSQRNWVVQPSTTIPNDQESFANWLYRVPGQTYKEGNLAASQHVNTGANILPWRSLSNGT
jgi:hypothetical protein